MAKPNNGFTIATIAVGDKKEIIPGEVLSPPYRDKTMAFRDLSKVSRQAKKNGLSTKTPVGVFKKGRLIE